MTTERDAVGAWRRYNEALRRNWVDAIQTRQDELEQAIIERYLAGCAAPGCGHDKMSSPHLKSIELRPGVDFERDTKPPEHEYIPRSELLARAWTLDDTNAALEAEVQEWKGSDAVDLQRAEAAEARLADTRAIAGELQGIAINAIRGLEKFGHVCAGDECPCLIGQVNRAILKLAALAPVVEGD